MPATKERPEEWTKWVAKGRHGMRAYHATPTIHNPQEFGITFVKWWHGMQPSFRKNLDLFPSPVYSPPETATSVSIDVWSALRKGGPNGLVSVMTLLVWWGQCALTNADCEDSTLNQWTAIVIDVRHCLERMMSVGQKRLRTEAMEATASSKWQVPILEAWLSRLTRIDVGHEL